MQLQQFPVLIVHFVFLLHQIIQFDYFVSDAFCFAIVLNEHRSTHEQVVFENVLKHKNKYRTNTKIKKKQSSLPLPNYITYRITFVVKHR
jgi:hypothetical protein